MKNLLIFASIIFLFWIGRDIFIPITVAIFLWYLINAIAAYYRKAMPYKYDSMTNTDNISLKSKAYNWLAGGLSVGTVLLCVFLFSTQIQPMFAEFAAAIPVMQEKLGALGNYIANDLGFEFSPDTIPDMSKIFTNIGASIAGVATTLGMVLIYLVFMFIEQSTFHKKFGAMFTSKRESKKFKFILNSIDENMKKYLFMKTFISGITGVLSYFWLSYLGLDFAWVWAFIVFITSYIPTIGAIIACTFPILYSFAMTGTLHQPVLIFIGLVGLQIIFGNIIEPRLTGKTLNLSTLAILINLVFWGMIWGPVGMFFSVPLLVGMFIITAQFDSTRWVAVLLSADGQIPDKTDEE